MSGVAPRVIGMGKNNKARRAAKARERSRRRARAQASSGDGRRLDDPFGVASGYDPILLEAQAAELWRTAFAEHGGGGESARRFAALASLPASIVDAQGEVFACDMLGRLWANGWQPAEVRRQVRREANAMAARLAELAILAEHDRRRGQRIDPRWIAQLEQFGQRDVSTRAGWLARWRAGQGIDRAASYQAVIALCHAVGAVPSLDVLIPPPGADASVVTFGTTAHTGASHPMLSRVRKLLAKAEASDFEAEAAAFTAKAQELMTRHAIDEALIEAGQAEDGPRMIRVPVDAPYADAKSVVLAAVAEANRSRAIYLKAVDLCSVIGHAEDLSAIELIFTSLLVQAQKALAEAGRNSGAGSRARSQSFRSSFFLAYAHRIGERLAAVNETAYAEGDADAALPVLRAREHAVEDFVADHYGDRLTSSSVRGGYDGLGHAYGRDAAERAKLAAGAVAS